MSFDEFFKSFSEFVFVSNVKINFGLIRKSPPLHVDLQTNEFQNNQRIVRDVCIVFHIKVLILFVNK